MGKVTTKKGATGGTPTGAKVTGAKGATQKKDSWVSQISKIHRTKDPLNYGMPKVEEKKK